jgi:hypothetical protein
MEAVMRWVMFFAALWFAASATAADTKWPVCKRVIHCDYIYYSLAPECPELEIVTRYKQCLAEFYPEMCERETFHVPECAEIEREFDRALGLASKE